MRYGSPSQLKELFLCSAGNLLKGFVYAEPFPGSAGLLAKTDSDAEGSLGEDSLQGRQLVLVSLLHNELNAQQFNMHFDPCPQRLHMNGLAHIVHRAHS